MSRSEGRLCDGRRSRSARSASDRLKSRYLGPGLLAAGPRNPERSRVGVSRRFSADPSPGVVGRRLQRGLSELRLGKPRRHKRLTTTIGTKPLETPHVLRTTRAPHSVVVGILSATFGPLLGQKNDEYERIDRMSGYQPPEQSATVGESRAPHAQASRAATHLGRPARSPVRRSATLPTICPL
jgi:hypothetical protein